MKFNRYIGSSRKKLRTTLTFVCLCLFASISHAEKMEANIQEALYLFEMKGEVSSSIKMLEAVARDGDEDDKENAYFYLGKIQELLNNKSSANFYYNQSLSRTNETNKAYWLANREGETSSQPENLLRGSINLKSNLIQVFGDNPTYLLLQDGSIKRIDDNKLIDVNAKLPENSQVLSVSPQGIWFTTSSQDSLLYKSLYAGKPNKSYPIAGVTEIYSHGDNTIAMSANALTVINSKGIVNQIEDRFNGCNIEGVSTTTSEFILNCTDNALHFISMEDGTDKRTIAQFDVIQKVLIRRGMLFTVSGSHLYGFLIKKSNNPIWKLPVNNVEKIIPFENNIALLEASGKVSIIDVNSGFVKASIRSDASTIATLALGTLGLFTDEGSIITVDTLLRPLWHFNFTRPIVRAPIISNNNIYLDLGNKKLTALAPHYYGQKKLQSEVLAQKANQLVANDQWEEMHEMLDTLFSLEPGNAEGWFFKALYLENHDGSEKEKQRAWSEAVRLSMSAPQVTQLILNQYSKAIGAKFVSILPISPKTRYPQFFNSKKNLYTIDPAVDQLFCINAETGEMRWAKEIAKLDNSPVIDNDENILAIASGYNFVAYDLNKEIQSINLQLPGKPFEIKITDASIFISTWNGFLLKIIRAENKLAWSRKVFSSPFQISTTGHSLYIASLDGEFAEIDENAGQIQGNTSRKIPGTIVQMQATDTTVAMATSNNKIYLFNPTRKDIPPAQILVEASISSLQIIKDQGKKMFLVGLSDQSILLYTEAGAPIWKHQGAQSIFSKPFVKDGLAWIDQGNELVAISIKTGKIEKKFSMPSGAGTPFIMNHTLFSASPNRLLYGFAP